MKLKIVGSGSAGNSYILTSSSGESLLIECGVKFSEIQKALDFKISSVVGCIVSHSHTDHIKGIFGLLQAGVPIYSSKGTFEGKKILGHHNAHVVSSGQDFKVGSFQIKPFDIKHDANEPFGFLIWHKEMGLTLFMTDTYYCEYRFPGLNHMIVEANYTHERLSRRASYLRDRIMESHMSIDTCRDMIRDTDLSDVVNIVLIHLSDSNSHEEQFVKEIEKVSGKQVFAANKGMVIDFNKDPF